jgi:hypothetical protein
VLLVDRLLSTRSIAKALRSHPEFRRLASQLGQLDPHFRVISQFPAFAPNSTGPLHIKAQHTLAGINEAFPSLVSLLTDIDAERVAVPVRMDSLCQENESIHGATCLRELFVKYGSDKSSTHNLHWLYGWLLPQPDEVEAVLEIGLGTNNVDVVSHMGRGGKPGASLRAFRDYLPKAQLFGADIDRRVLFNEDRISTFFADQTDSTTLANLGARVGRRCDLIIDDGLHSPLANIATLKFALNRLRSGGAFVVEDIRVEALPIWQVVAVLLPAVYQAQLVEDEGSTSAFVVRRTV